MNDEPASPDEQPDDLPNTHSESGPKPPPKPDPAPTPEPGPGPAASTQPPPPAADGSLTSDDRMWAMFAHLAGVVGALVGAGSFGFIGPLIIMLVKGEENAFIKTEAKEALNFQITMLIAFVVVMILSMITCGVGALLFLPLVIVGVIFPVLGGLEANKGVNYKYPVTLRLIK